MPALPLLRCRFGLLVCSCHHSCGVGRANDVPNMKNTPLRVCFSCLKVDGGSRNAPNTRSTSHGHASLVGGWGGAKNTLSMGAPFMLEGWGGPHW